MFHLLVSGESVPVIKIYVYYGSVGLMVILLFFLLWRIWKFTKLYAEFPTFPLLIYGAYLFVTRQMPKNIPFTAVFFQNLVLLSKQFQKEGVYLIWAPYPYLFVFGEKVVKAFNKEPEALDKSSIYHILSDLFGNGLLTSNGNIWRTHRKLLTPVFHMGMVKNKMSIFNENAEILVHTLEGVANGTSINVYEHIKTCTFGIICDYVLGLKMNIPENRELVNNYTKLITNVFGLMVHRFAHPWMHVKCMKKFLPRDKKYTKLIEDSKNFAREIISEMRKKIIEQQVERTSGEDDWNDDAENRKSFTHILVDNHLKDNSFTMEDIENQVTTFIVAGYDTVSCAVLWNLFVLGHHPDVQDQAYNEVFTISEEKIKYEDLQNLKYLECVIKETMRLYPPVPLHARRLNKDIKCGKYNVPRGTNVVFLPYALHRNPEVYPDPEKFYPDRFLEGNLKKMSGNHIAFSEGIRSCIGKRFAMMEMKVMLAYILRNFRITSLDKIEDVDLNWNITLTPSRPLRFQFTPRKSL